MLVKFTFDTDDGYFNYRLITDEEDPVNYTIDIASPKDDDELLYIIYQQYWFDIDKYDYLDDAEDDEKEEIIKSFQEELSPTIISITSSLSSAIEAVEEYIKNKELDVSVEPKPEDYNVEYRAEVIWRHYHDEERYSSYLLISSLK